MEVINKEEQLSGLKENTIVGNPKLTNSKITFKGKGNILYCDKDNINIVNTSLSFNGNNSIIFLCKSMHRYILNVAIYNDSVLYLGENNYINGTLNIIVSERKNIIIGNNGLFSFHCWLRTSDAHLVYDSNTQKRINPSKSIYLGDHVWIGQHVFILKGTQIGSGSIIGGLSVVSGKTIESNSSYAGNPVKKIGESIFFTKDSVHLYNEEETKSHDIFEGDEYIYSYNEEEQLPFNKIEESLQNIKSASKKLDYILHNLKNNQLKNRFFISKPFEKQNLVIKIKRWLFSTKIN
jgi:acetyltransferase-like isoleucine patch superfamily enzyme